MSESRAFIENELAWEHRTLNAYLNELDHDDDCEGCEDCDE